MRPKTSIVLFFSLLAAFFYGIGLTGDLSDAVGYGLIGTVHAITSIGIHKGHETVIALSPYLALLDMLFGLLWVMIGLTLPAVTLTLLSALALFILMDEDVRTELRGGP
ncbi:hypothetical protein [Thermococcus sp.]|uniref:hypothetical protein n=1 Tax=Thermococcus sp. TaxID=35749 RepID=UPI002635822A|nr:hypothetical protein [Thermococcus sp.]